MKFLVVPGIAPSGDAAKKSSWGLRVAVEGSSTIQRNRGGVPGRPQVGGHCHHLFFPFTKMLNPTLSPGSAAHLSLGREH